MDTNAGLTRNEEAVLNALRESDAPQSAYQLLETLREAGLRAPPQVYRALKSLGERGLVHKLDSRNAFLACNHAHGHGCRASVVVFLVCEHCHSVREVAGGALSASTEALAAGHDFVHRFATVEISGRCGACAPN